MQPLNFHHLRYFWTVARLGSVRAAAERLHVSQPTVSAQVRALEESLGERLFRRAGRGLALTEAGVRVCRYGDEIFALGDELQASLRHPEGTGPLRVAIGVTDSLPKSLAHAILRPAYASGPKVQVVCHEGRVTDLLGELAAFRLDLVIADEHAPSSSPVKAHHHLLGDSAVTWCAAPRLAARLKGRFPRSLEGAPVLLPPTGSPLRRLLDPWFEIVGVQPQVVAEYDDRALMKMAAAEGLGALPLPAAATREATQRWGLRVLGRAGDCREQYYAITTERRVHHPAVLAITRAAHTVLSDRPRG
jgi:LysR family transcriptional regulator, transcriptional activator of nhaA